MKKIAKIISRILLGFFILILMVITVPKLIGFETFSVVSGSMEPSISTGSLIYAKPTGFDTIKKGDIITFTLNKDLTVATHRVVEVDEENKLFTTKGDANDSADNKQVAYNNVIGVVKLHIPYLGYLAYITSTLSGKIVLACLFLFLFCLNLLLEDKDKIQNIFKDKDKEDIEKETEEDSMFNNYKNITGDFSKQDIDKMLMTSMCLVVSCMGLIMENNKKNNTNTTKTEDKENESFKEDFDINEEDIVDENSSS